METTLLRQISVKEFFEKLRAIIKEDIKLAMQQNQLLTKKEALKMSGINNSVFMKALNEGLVKPHLVKRRKKAMYIEFEVPKSLIASIF